MNRNRSASTVLILISHGKVGKTMKLLAQIASILVLIVVENLPYKKPDHYLQLTLFGRRVNIS
jgi:hypothetical protein